MGISFARLIVVCAAPIVFAAASFGQTASLPRVGTIKDYPATGLTSGCNNLYSIRRADAKRLSPQYVFISRAGGNGAWMNLNGRDVRLRKLRAVAPAYPKPFQFHYRWATTSIDVYFRAYRPRPGEDGQDHMFELTIKLRRGKNVRSLRALGHSDC